MEFDSNETSIIVTINMFWSNVVFASYAIIYFISANSTLTIKDVAAVKGDLLFSQVIFRHGDRTPLRPYPGNVHGNISYWQGGLGQLTNLGKQQQYELGQWLRLRYGNYLSETYDSNDIFIRSSDVDRTLMGAYLTLSGLYPPKNDQIWNKHLLWQPIPVHTTPRSIDNLLASSVPHCPSYEAAFMTYLESMEMEKFNKSIQPILNKFSNETGTVIESYENLSWIYDTILIETGQNLTLPNWSKGILTNNSAFYQAALKRYYLSSSTKFIAKFRSGFLLDDILLRFNKKIEKSLKPDRKMWIYGTHDSVITNLLFSMEVFDFKFVSYAATIIFELRQYDEEYYVQVFYKRSDESETAEPLSIPGCGFSCLLLKFRKIYGTILPKYDFATECQTYET